MWTVFYELHFLCLESMFSDEEKCGLYSMSYIIFAGNPSLGWREMWTVFYGLPFLVFRWREMRDMRTVFVELHFPYPKIHVFRWSDLGASRGGQVQPGSRRLRREAPG